MSRILTVVCPILFALSCGAHAAVNSCEGALSPDRNNKAQLSAVVLPQTFLALLAPDIAQRMAIAIERDFLNPSHPDLIARSGIATTQLVLMGHSEESIRARVIDRIDRFLQIGRGRGLSTIQSNLLRQTQLLLEAPRSSDVSVPAVAPLSFAVKYDLRRFADLNDVINHSKDTPGGFNGYVDRTAYGDGLKQAFELALRAGDRPRVIESLFYLIRLGGLGEISGSISASIMAGDMNLAMNLSRFALANFYFPQGGKDGNSNFIHTAIRGLANVTGPLKIEAQQMLVDLARDMEANSYRDFAIQALTETGEPLGYLRSGSTSYGAQLFGGQNPVVRAEILRLAKPVFARQSDGKYKLHPSRAAIIGLLSIGESQILQLHADRIREQDHERGNYFAREIEGYLSATTETLSVNRPREFGDLIAARDMSDIIADESRRREELEQNRNALNEARNEVIRSGYESIERGNLTGAVSAFVKAVYRPGLIDVADVGLAREFDPHGETVHALSYAALLPNDELAMRISWQTVMSPLRLGN